MKNQPLSIAHYIKRFFAEYLPSHRNCSPHTIASYSVALRLFLVYLRERKKIAPAKLAVRDLSAGNIMEFLNEIQASRRNGTGTRNVRLAAIRSFVNYLLLLEPALTSELQAVLAIPVKRDTRRVLDFLTREELDAVLAAPQEATWSGKRDRILYTVMYNSGARVSEIVAAKVSDVKLNPGATLRLHGKGRKDRVLPLWKSTAKNLGQWIAGNRLEADAPLFANARGAHMTRSGVEKRLREAVRAAREKCPSLKSKRVSPHTLRHTTAMHLLHSGVDITLIAMWLGHESIETTHIYMTTDLAMKEKALQALQSPTPGKFRFQPNDELIAFLESL
ncbi:MAG TPA: site-specific integrase [Candidatus Hydrogenedentes bacterium]|nr:site-specific integrase [Candidatus Hydrogenedentota bacterium]HOR29270.1 site-specific integrase [Candidatus Sumerlaeota bacterium]HPK00479.1 site-specific integrase [Candidatus Hydrogenedentota bacterium]